MTCIYVDDETMLDYLENRLQDPLRERVEAHLCTCAACRDLLMLAAALMHDRQRYPADPVSSSITQRAIEAIEALSTHRYN